MRRSALVFAALCVVGGRARAGAITETISFSGSPSNGGDTVSGPVFNPSFGTLTGVTMIATGTYTPDIFVGGAVTDPRSNLYVDAITFGPGSGLTTTEVGGETLTYNNGFLTGAAERFTDTATVTNPLALSTVYTAFGPYQTGGLLGLNVFSKPFTPGAWGSLADDVSDYSGTLSVTFDYDPLVTVSEPASLALFGFGCAAILALARPRRWGAPAA